LSVVVDACTLIAALVDYGPDGEWAESIIAGASLYAPEVAFVEATDTLRRFERAKRITAAEANAAHEDLMELNIEIYSFEPFAERIWELRHNVTSYDAWYVAVAEALHLPLVTLDARLVKANGPTCEFLTLRR
jgi:predicted nucleic acid-binding protein